HFVVQLGIRGLLGIKTGIGVRFNTLVNLDSEITRIRTSVGVHSAVDRHLVLNVPIR
ncbi:hypothetical protein D030_1805B, partial [Vibrio parahaemolyticus AQ3810]